MRIEYFWFSFLGVSAREIACWFIKPLFWFVCYCVHVTLMKMAECVATESLVCNKPELTWLVTHETFMECLCRESLRLYLWYVIPLLCDFPCSREKKIEMQNSSSSTSRSYIWSLWFLFKYSESKWRLCIFIWSIHIMNKRIVY